MVLLVTLNVQRATVNVQCSYSGDGLESRPKVNAGDKLIVSNALESPLRSLASHIFSALHVSANDVSPLSLFRLSKRNQQATCEQGANDA